MASSLDALDVLRGIRERSYAEGGVFWIREGELGVFDPEAAQQVNALNFDDLTLPDKLADLLRGRSSKPFSWKTVRAAWTAQLRKMSDAGAHGALADRMGELLDERLGRPVDLVWAAQEVCTQSLVPVVVAGLSARDTKQVLRDQDYKLQRLLKIELVRETFWESVRSIRIQVGAGSAVRRELRGRAKGRRPRRLDLTDPIVDLLPDLGLDRAVDAVTTVLTAIAGPPGAAGACLIYELTRRPDWAEKLTAELAAVPPDQLYKAPTRLAPATYRFVRETLRMWTPPLLMTRPVRNHIDLEKASLDEGQRYLLSAYLMHHDPNHWQDPDTFDPDRWLAGAEHGPCSHAAYAPFGWAPRACIGASFGTVQLILLCHLLCTRYRIEIATPGEVRMALTAVAMPLDFHGTITRR
jgi:cytochrome P450